MVEFTTPKNMHLSIREQVLLALWAEYQRDIPKLAHVNCNVLGIARPTFNMAYNKLGNEGLLAEMPDLCLNWQGLEKATAMIPFYEDCAANAYDNLIMASQFAEHYNAPLLSKFICEIAQEFVERNQPQKD